MFQENTFLSLFLLAGYIISYQTNNEVSHIPSEYEDLISAVRNCQEPMPAINAALRSLFDCLFLGIHNSYKALHALVFLQRCEKPLETFRNTVETETGFLDSRLRDKLASHCNLCEQLKPKDECMHPDLVSVTLATCPKCFLMLLRYGVVHLGSFNIMGLSLVKLAIHVQSRPIVIELISAMKAMQLLAQCSIADETPSKTILELALECPQHITPQLIKSCRSKVELIPWNESWRYARPEGAGLLLV